MIFIKDKKAWKEFVKGCSDEFMEDKPREFPCYVELVGCDWVCEQRTWEYIYLEDLQSMAEKIEKGREF